MTDSAAGAGSAADGNVAAAAQRLRPLTSTERSRNSRARRRAEAAQVRRQPYVHASAVDPLAAAVVAELLDSGDAPEHVTRPRFRAALAAYGRTEATVRLIAAWVASLPGMEA